MKNKKNLLAGLLCVCLLGGILPPRATAVTLTAVNDTLLPLSDNTMPTYRGGELYVPYTVITSFGVVAEYANNILSLSSGGVSLTFSLTEGSVYDQNLTSYSTPAYLINGTIYVPIKLVCGKFGLGYSTFTVAGETVLRITSSNASSDDAFVSRTSDAISRAINIYNGVPTPTPGSTGSGTTSTAPSTSTTQTPPPAEKPEEVAPIHKPQQVYLAFYGPTSEHTAAILDTLRSSGRRATFFLPTDSTDWTDDTVRRIIGEGHTIGLLLYNNADSPDTLVRSLEAANTHLALLTGSKTRLVSFADGSRGITLDQRDALADAGYRIWDSTYDSGDNTRSPAQAVTAIEAAFATTDSSAVLRLRHTATTAETLQKLSVALTTQSIPVSPLTVTATPINFLGERR